MKLSEVFSVFFTEAKNAGIEIEADEVVTIAAADPIAAPAPDTSALEADMAAQRAELEQARARIAKMEDEARAARFASLASAWVGDKAGHLLVLAELGEGSPAFAAHITQQNAVAELVRASGVFQEIGSSANGGAGAWAQIESKARSLMAQAPGLTFEQATVQVMDADQALYRQYLAEQQ